MATIEYTNAPTKTSVAFVAQWEHITGSDVGAPLMGAQYTDKSVQVVGNFGAGTLEFQGSNNGVDWAVLTDPQGNNLNFTQPKIELVSEATVYVRPVVSGGDGTTDLSVYLMMKE